jgi:ATP-grasp domain, R2K clade family 2
MWLYQETDNNSKWCRQARPNQHWVSWWTDQPIPEGDIQGAIGTIEWTYALIDKLGYERPITIGYETFPELQKHWAREVKISTLRNFRYTNLIRSYNPKFVKPADQLKLWTGQVFKTGSHPYLDPHPDDTRVEIHEVVEFVEEYRGFWDGNYMEFVQYPVPDEGIKFVDWCFPLILILNDLSGTPLVVDVGRCSDGVWRIVEIGLPFAMGAYGAEEQYMKCHEIWWENLKCQQK